MQMISHIQFIHHSHTDFGYTDEPERIRILHQRYLEEALEQIEATQSGPADQRFYWTVESSYVAKEFCHRHGRKGKHRLLAALESGQLEIAGLLHQPITHLQSLEELRHNFDWTLRFYREAGMSCRVAILCDLGSATWSLADIMADQGIKMFILAVGSYRVLSPWSKLPPVFWWEGPRGGRVLFYTYHVANEPPGPTRRDLFPASYGWGYVGFAWPARARRMAAGEKVIPTPFDELIQTSTWPEVEAETLLSKLEKDGHPCSNLLIQIGSDNAGPDPNIPADIQWLNQKLHPRTAHLGLAGDYVDRIDRDPPVDLPVLRGDLHCPWSDQAISLPAAVARHREAARFSRSAVRLGRKARAPQKALRMADEIYNDLLAYTDHTFGLSSWGFGEMKANRFGPWDPLSLYHESTWKRKETFAHSAWVKARQLYAEIQERMERKLPQDADGAFVNTLDRASEPQVIPLMVLSPYRRPTSWKSGSKEIPVQAESVQPKWWRMWVPVPALRAGKVWSGSLQCEKEQVAGTEIGGKTHTSSDPSGSEPGAFDLRLDDVSLRFDEETGRCVSWRGEDGQERLAVPNDHGLGEFVYAEVEGIPEDGRGAGIGWPIERRFAICEAIDCVRGANGPLTANRIVRRRLVTNSGLRLETATEWRLLAGHDEVHIAVTIDKPRNVLREDGRVAFPFAGACRDIAWDLAGTAVRWKDLLPGSHTGWLTIQKLVAIECEWGTVALMSLDAPLIEAGGITAETWRGHGQPPARACAYSYVFNNFYQTNIPQWQGGHVTWRYLLRCFPGPLDADGIWKWAEERDGGVIGIRRCSANP